MKGIHLCFFKKAEVIYNVKKLKSGDLLSQSKFKSSIFIDAAKEKMIELSAHGKERFDMYLKKGYRIERIIAKYIVIWYEEDTAREYRVVLPELWLCR